MERKPILNKIYLRAIVSITLVFATVFASAQTNRRNTKRSVAYKANHQRMSAGDEHALELRDGALWAWGRNQYGQVGNGTSVTQTSPVQIGTATTWVSVSAGGLHSLALKADGTLWVWGGNTWGSLGDGTTTSRNFPVQIGAANNWIAVSAADKTSYAIKSDGTLWAWGYNGTGQVGDGTTTQRNAPVQVGVATNWVTISGGYGHAIALKSDGTIWTWGSNTYGQIGDGTTTQRNSPVQVGVATNYTQIVAGNSWCSVLRSDGTLWAWGDNGGGSLGDGTTIQRNSPVQIGTSTDWANIQASDFTSLGLKSDGTYWAWGDNTFGSFGDGTVTASLSPAQVGIENDWVSFEGGGFFAMGQKSNGTIRTWGRNNFGQIGNGTITAQENNQIAISVASNGWLALASGWKHTLAVKENGTLWAWGRNSLGQLGDGTNTQRTSPVQIGTGTTWVSVAGGYTSSYAIKSDGTLWSWGENTYGQLGDGTVVSHNVPVQVGVANDWVSISGAQFQAFALKSNGTLWGWGRNQFSSLGDGTSTQRNSPVQLGVSNLWTSISAGAMHCLALRANGTLWAWGYNFYYPLGSGLSSDSNIPIQIGVLTTWVSISASEAHSHGIKADGTLWSWGQNTNGQVGDGTTTHRIAPVQIGALNTWMSVAAGWAQAIALKTDGTLWGWGRNDIGQLGDGTFTQRPSPIQIGAITNWVFIAQGQGHSHSLAIKAERNQYCYSGYNTDGELGDCTITNRNVFNCIDMGAMVTSNPINVAICPGANATFTIAADNATNYQWQENGVNITTGAYAGFTTNTLTVISAGLVLNGKTYSCIVSVSGGCPPPDTSSAAILTVNSLPGVSANASPSSSVCAGQNVTLSGGGASAYTWSGGVTNGVSFIPGTTTTYTVTGIDVNGCQNTSNIIVTVNSLPTIGSSVSPSGSVCSGTGTLLNGTGGVSYTWTGGVINAVAFFPTASMTYTVIGTDGNGCQNTATKTITVNPLPTVTANASPSASICYGQIVTLNGGGAGSYIWTGGAGGIFNGIGFQPLTTATYSVTGTDGNGCQNTNTITVTVNPLPTVSSTASPSATICAGENVTLNGTGANTYTWSGGVFNGASFTPASSVTYTVTGTDVNGCQNTSTRTVIVNSLPLVSAGAVPSNVICFGQNLTLSGSGASTYSWTGGAINGIAFSPSASGTYTVTGTDGNGCQNTATKSITVNLLPVVTASVTNDTICLGSSTVLTAAGANNYSWSANAGSAVTASVSVSPAATETFTVTGTDLNSCSNTTSLSVNVLLVPTPSICMVTVDDASINNIIYWDKTSYTNADSFIVYREVSTLIYKRIGTVSVDSLSEYVDTARSVGPANGNPNVGSYRYKLQMRDTCGNYGSLSPYHNTIYIIDAGSGQFTWSIPYTIEGSPNPVANYVLLCDTANVDVWTPVGTVAGTQSSATDPGFSNHATIANWRVETAWSISCTPTRVVVNTTRSNIKHPSITIGTNSKLAIDATSIYPNPATDYVSIELPESILNANIRIMNSIGQIVVEQTITASGNSKTKKQINTSNFAKGIYTVAIESNKAKTFKKLVIN